MKGFAFLGIAAFFALSVFQQPGKGGQISHAEQGEVSSVALPEDFPSIDELLEEIQVEESVEEISELEEVVLEEGEEESVEVYVEEPLEEAMLVMKEDGSFVVEPVVEPPPVEVNIVEELLE